MGRGYDRAVPFIRKLVAPATSTAVGVGILLSHASPELAVIGATSAGQLVDGVLPVKRTREQVVADKDNRVNRAQAYEDFGTAVALCWQAGGQLLTYRPKILGYVHGMALLVRSQRRFEEQYGAATTALGKILLYGSSETQDAAVAVFKTLA
jgi:hypothetical protein